jgi:hypothetical protein
VPRPAPSGTSPKLLDEVTDDKRPASFGVAVLTTTVLTINAALNRVSRFHHT